MASPAWGRLLAGAAPADLGLRAGRLKPCPDTPNCVSSQAEGKALIAPLAFAGAPDAAMARLKTTLASLPRVRLTQESETYLRAEAASRVFGFVDDLEFHVDPAAAVVHVRSASRLGYRDFGVNRKRVESIRSLFSAAR